MSDTFHPHEDFFLSKYATKSGELGMDEVGHGHMQ